MNSVKIAVIGLGYVGLPLARLFSTKYQTPGRAITAFVSGSLRAASKKLS